MTPKPLELSPRRTAHNYVHLADERAVFCVAGVLNCSDQA